MLRSVVLLCSLGLAGPALAHPHVFIDTAIEAIMSPDGRVDAIRISWTYDEFYTLMILEERGLD